MKWNSELALCLQFSEHELAIASQLVEPSTIQTSWNDIAGLSSIIEELQETLIIPIAQRERFKGSTLIKPPKGWCQVVLSF